MEKIEKEFLLIMSFKKIAIWYLLIQGIGGAGWWIALFVWPNFRNAFLAEGAPDSMLLAFVIPDSIFFVAASFVSSYGVAKSKSWAGAVLWLHAGATAFAGLYCWGLVILSKGDGLTGALMMTPSLVIPFLIAKIWNDRMPKNVQ